MSWRRLGDGAALVFGASAFAECTRLGWPEPLLGMATLAWVTGLLLRHRLPLAPLVVPVVFAACLTVGAPAIRVRSLFPGLLLSTWLVGLHAVTGRERAAVAMALFLSLAILSHATGSRHPGEDLFFLSAFALAAFLMGDFAGRQFRRADDARARFRREDAATDERVRTATVRERARIARELHDVIGHGVTLMTVQAGAARSLIAQGDRDGAREALRAIEDAGQDALDEMRRLLGVLRSDGDIEVEDPCATATRAPARGLVAPQ